MNLGTIVRFDRVRGYGFVTPDEGGDDVFFHASLLGENEEALIRTGMRVEYQAAPSDRGPKAVSARLLDLPAPAPGGSGAVRTRSTAPGREDDDLCEVLTVAEFGQEITDVLIDVIPTVTGAQITRVRQRLTAPARRRGWVD